MTQQRKEHAASFNQHESAWKCYVEELVAAHVDAIRDMGRSRCDEIVQLTREAKEAKKSANRRVQVSFAPLSAPSISPPC